MAALFGIRSLARPNGARVVVRCAGMVTRRYLKICREPATTSGRKEERGLEKMRHFAPDSAVYHPALFTLTTPCPGQLTKDEFFSSLQQAASAAPQPHHSVEEERTIVILTTPSFATWIQDVDFICRIVDTLSKGCLHLEHIQTTAAVVDGLFPPRKTSTLGVVAQSAEGFSFMITSGTSTAKHQSLDIIQDISADSTPSSGLRFNFIKRDYLKPKALVEFTVPLANTLFRNGRPSTLLVANWVKNTPNQFVATSVEYKEAYTVRTEEFRFRQAVHLPLDELTEPRRIVAGLGNIVRQLEGDSGEPLPASTELEESVVSYLTAKKLPQQQVSVWALVVSEKELLFHRKKFPHARNTWQLIRGSGASLHRVLSGGGGWGAKSGLLSLDPETTAPGSQPDHDFSAFRERFADVDEQTQALGNIAKPGSYVWFLIAHKGLVDESGKLANLDSDNDSFLRYEEKDGEVVKVITEEYHDKDPYRRIVLGCVRSTIDDIPATSSDAHPTGKREGSQMQLCREFSAQSELGLFVRVRTLTELIKGSKGNIPWAEDNATKIDVPGARFDAW